MEIKVSERCHGTTLRRNANTRCKHVTNRSTLCHQHLKTDKSLRIKEPSLNKKEIQGRSKYGLFTTGFIPAGGRICYWTGETLEQNPDSKFALQILKRPPTWVDASRSDTGEARYARACMNPAKCENNAVLKHDKKSKKTYLEALRDINAGEEILSQPEVLNQGIKSPVTPKKPKEQLEIQAPEESPAIRRIPKPRRRVRIIVPDEDEFEEPDFEDASQAIRRENEQDLPQGFDADDDEQHNPRVVAQGGSPKAQARSLKKKEKKKKRNYLAENKKREEVYELKILKRLLLIQTLFRDSKLAQKNLTRPKPNYKIVPPSGGDLDKLDKLLRKEEKELLKLYKSGGQNRTMTLGDLQKELDALGKKRK